MCLISHVVDLPTFPSAINFPLRCIVTGNSAFAGFESIYSGLIFWPNIWSILENVPRALVKSMESVCLCPGHTCPRSTVLRGHLSLSGAPVGSGGHFHALVTGEITGTKGTPFCQPVTLSTPILW